MTIYLGLIQENCIKNKYTKWYIGIIKNAKNRIKTSSLNKQKNEAKTLLGYVELHHIWPRCLCTSDNQIQDFKNKVFLTLREHIICHMLLSKMFNNTNAKHKMMHACGAFTFNLNENQRKEMKIINSRTLSLLRLEHVKGMSERMSGENNPNYGKHAGLGVKCPDYTNNGITGKWERTPEHCKAISIRATKQWTENNPMTIESSRAKVGASKIGRKIAHNPITQERKYVYPDKIPDGFVIGQLPGYVRPPYK